jgi:hypothetical protein
MVKVLDGEQDGHGESEKTNESEDDFETEALIELNLYQQIFPLSRFPTIINGEGS